ncbi:uncharacterized protein THITE_2117979 [Thermothielavioides terrestris NRRL 8126]|uniref:C3H1-type domain-containing protein n=1 Tax=Thermothielavioides terrestris (strain ATCC 38088 / NRRL 8126) TaxID=578455 RepID=G2R6A8_THETT|nr:uncharacterized protein THITE_2117979 [Thermothielavioides terrestris NRRL 8126]AEO68441.1 hypothetical protein THITE_2117979 [Thermothielavioides terrestris NRRL 8126]
MTVCRFYQQGYCRYGNACKFEHPPKGGQQNYNRFGVFGGQTGPATSGRAADSPPYPGLTADAIQRDLTSELPQWILSCYGPGRDAPEQLWGGYPREQSFEEIRLHYMMGAMAGNPNGALNDIQTLYQNAMDQIQHTVNNIPAAIQFILDAEKRHPNRIDVCKGSTGQAAAGGAFGTTANAFQPAAPPRNPFGAPATPTSSVGSAFGQPSALGQKPSPFGAPATGFGQAAQPAFGQPSTLGGTPAFGQTSALGVKPNPFGAPALTQPTQPAGGSGFGQPAFGQPATLGAKPNPFGAPASGGGSFGVTQPVPPNNPFGQPAQPQAQNAPSLFGQPATAQPANNPFGQPSTTSPFGQPAPAAAKPFGQPQQAPATQPFGGPATTAAAPPALNAFAQPAPTTTTSTATAAASAAASAGQAANPYGPGATRQHPDPSTYSTRDADGRLRTFKGRPVTYETPRNGGKPVPVLRNFDGSAVRIWMPNGPPPYTADSEAEPAQYEDEAVKEQWRYFVETGRFKDGVMPEVPPKREFCLWDF